MHLTLALALLVSFSLKGVIRIDGTRPLERPVLVEVTRMGERIAEQLAAADGTFSFSDLQPGPYVVIARSAGYPQSEMRVDVLGNSGDRDVVLELLKRKSVKPFASALNRSTRYLNQKRYAEAELLLKKTIRRSPEEGDAYFALALVYFEQNRWEDAISTGSQAHSRAHRIPDVHLLLAKCYGELRNEGGVHAELERFLKEAPNGPAKADARKALELLTR